MVPRFKLTDLLLLTVAVALGCAATQAENIGWYEGALISVALLVGIITARESMALNHVCRSALTLSADQRFELTFLAWGRFVVVMAMFVVLAIDFLGRQNAIALPEDERGFEITGQRARSALIDLSLLICVVNPTTLMSPIQSSWWRSAIWIATWAAGTIWAILVLLDQMMVYFLVYIAVQGIESAQPYWLTTTPASHREWNFAYAISSQVFVVIVLLAAIRPLTQVWHRRPRLRRTLIVILIAGLIALTLCTTYLLTYDFQEIAPAMFEGIVVGPIHRWIACGLLVLIAMVAFAYVQVRASQTPDTIIEVELPRSSFSRWTRPLLVLMVYSVAAVYAYAAIIENSFFKPPTWEEILWYALYPNFYLPIAVWITAVWQFVRCWRPRKRGAVVTIVGLPRGQFATIVTFSVALGIVGSAILVWTAFALWLTPWYELI